MKMSIKYKLPLFIILIFLGSVLILSIYFRFCLFENLGNDLDVVVNRFDQIDNSVLKGISDYYPDQNKMQDFIQSISLEKSIAISVRDIEGTEVFTGNYKVIGPALKQKEFAFSQGKVIYMLEIVHPFPPRILSGSSSIVAWRNFGLFLIGLMIFSLILYLHYTIVKPLTVLYNKLDNFNYHQFSLDLPNQHRKDEIGYFCTKFSEMASRLEKAHNEQIDMILSISHDLKTPLTSVIGFVERLMSGNMKSEQRKNEYYEIIFNKACDMKILLEEFQDFATNEFQDASYQYEFIKVKDFFDELCRKYCHELKQYQADFTSDCQVSEDSLMRIDAGKLQRVFDNLITNSVKYSPGSLAIQMNCYIKGKNVCFSIEDNGKGVPEEELRNIFEKFYRVEKSRSRDQGGSGLGLAICRRIIENQGGEIWAYSSALGGLGISFYIPLENLNNS